MHHRGARSCLSGHARWACPRVKVCPAAPLSGDGRFAGDTRGSGPEKRVSTRHRGFTLTAEPACLSARTQGPVPGGNRALCAMVELRGFEPLTPSMRTRCATGLRHSPEDIPRLAGFGECSEPTDPVGGCRPKAPRGSYGKKSWWALQSPAALRRASTYWS